MRRMISGLKIFGWEGAAGVIIAVVLTLGVINFVWNWLSPSGFWQNLAMLIVSVIGGVILFVVIMLLLVTALLPWFIKRRMRRMFRVPKKYR